MENVHKCTSVLRPLIAEAKTNGIPLAENAINELVATTPALFHEGTLHPGRLEKGALERLANLAA